ncbi:MAG TPA: ATP-binding protein [Burkholderiaceae bacterium]|nr:ATP-binding protein [Burkholderiaceae bacterium]
MDSKVARVPGRLSRHERLLVWVGDNANAEALVRHASQWVANSATPWTAIAVHTIDAKPSVQERRWLLRAMELAERLGAETASVYTNSVLDAVVERAREDGATVVMIGGHPPDGWLDEGRRHWLGDLADGLSKRLPDVTVTVVQYPSESVSPRSMLQRSVRWRMPLPAVFITLTVVALCTAISMMLEQYVDVSTIDMVYLAGIVFVALNLGQTAAVLAVLASLLVFDLIFVPPRWSLIPAETQFFFTFGVMLVISLLVARLVAHARLQAHVAASRARRTQALNELARELVGATSEAHVATALTAAVRSTFGAESQLWAPDARGALRVADGRGPDAGGPLPDDATQQLFAQGVMVDAVPDTAGHLPHLLLRGVGGPLAVLTLQSWHDPGTAPEDRALLDAFANQAALALERRLFEHRSAKASIEAETERLRNTLLSAISHDFRTPLTTIIGSASSLLEQSAALDESRRQRLLGSIVAEAQRMHGSMSDLLDLTRMEEGAVRPDGEWCPADELVAEARQQAASQLREHTLQLQVPGDAIVWCDPRLMQQALANLLHNAARHTPRGSTITVGVRVSPSHWQLEVRDNGPGLPPGSEREVFKKFHRAQHEPTGAGTGLGLAICAAVARLHGGDIDARNDGGACFTMTLPQPAARAPSIDEER